MAHFKSTIGQPSDPVRCLKTIGFLVQFLAKVRTDIGLGNKYRLIVKYVGCDYILHNTTK